MRRGFSILIWSGLFSVLMAAEPAPRLVSVGGAVTETLYALGLGEQIVAVDSSSVYPEAATRLPQVGYNRALSTEGILSLKPTRVIGTAESGPPQVIAQITAARIPFSTLPVAHDAPAAMERFRALGNLVGKEAEAEKLAQAVEADLAKVQTRISARPHPRVVFIYARGSGTLNVAGRETAGGNMIALAGGLNPITAYEGYKPLTAEALVEADPEVLLLTARGLESLGGIDGLLRQPGVALTRAGKMRRIVALDDLYLLGFGPRLGQAAMELASRLQNP